MWRYLLDSTAWTPAPNYRSPLQGGRVTSVPSPVEAGLNRMGSIQPSAETGRAKVATDCNSLLGLSGVLLFVAPAEENNHSIQFCASRLAVPQLGGRYHSYPKGKPQVTSLHCMCPKGLARQADYSSYPTCREVGSRWGTFLSRPSETGPPSCMHRRDLVIGLVGVSTRGQIPLELGSL